MSVVQDVHGVKTVIDLQGDDLVTGTIQDCTPILEDAQARQNAGFVGSSEMRHASRLPMVVVETYCNVNGITFDGATKDAMQRAVRDALIAFMAATAQAQAAPKLVRRLQQERVDGTGFR